MTRIEIFRLISEIEEKFPVHSWKSRGFLIWPILRILISYSFYTNRNSGSVNPAKSYQQNKIDIDNLINQQDVIFLTTNLVKIKVDNIWYDRICDPIIDKCSELGYGSLVLEIKEDNKLREPAHTESLSIQHHINYILENITYPISDTDSSIELHEEFFKFMKERADFDLDIQTLLNRVNRIRELADYFKLIFSKVNPKLGLMVCYYSEIGMAFTLACKEYGIPSIDIQHGLQGDLHVAYGQWSAVPKNGFELLPTYFWCWGGYEKNVIENWSHNILNHKVIVGGNPWVNLWKEKNENLNPIISLYDKKLKSVTSSSEYQMNILITLQPLYGLRDWDQNLPEWVINVIENSPSDWKWFIRLHPQMLDKYYSETESLLNRLSPFIEIGKIEWQKSTEYPLMAVLRHMNVHITAFSTCIVEAEMLGVRSVVLHEDGVLSYPVQFKSGWIIKAFTSQELIKAINQQCSFTKFNNKQTEIFKDNIEPILDSLLNTLLKKEIVKCNEKYIRSKYVQILYIDEKYKFIIDNFSDVSDPIVSNYVGKSLEKMGASQKAYYFYKNYLKSLEADEAIGFYHLKELERIIRMYKETNIYYKARYLLIKVLRKDPSLVKLICQRMFSSQDFEGLLDIFLTLDHSLDVIFYLGRTYKSLQKYDLANSYLNKFIQKYHSIHFKGSISVTHYEEKLVSAYFHLGEVSLYKSNIIEAKKCFQLCLTYTQNNHTKAREYIENFSIGNHKPQGE
ncbi:tetratricopeptide repeat protein [Bacillus sp. AK128]